MLWLGVRLQTYWTYLVLSIAIYKPKVQFYNPFEVLLVGGN